MSDQELICVMIDQYGDLQRIKAANGGRENSALDYAIALAAAKLSSCGVDIEDITLNEIAAPAGKEYCHE